MKHKKIYWLLSVAIVLCNIITYSQRAVVKVVAMSPTALSERGWTSNASTGLAVVGKGTVVYLYATERAGAVVTTAAWEMVSKPSGSATILDSTTTLFTTFKPDTVGQYQVKLTITTATGTDDTIMSIYSAKFAGVGGVGGVPPNVGQGQCAACHQPKVTPWATSGHANHFKNGINGVLGSYSSNCIRCHTTGYDKQATATNNAFDDIATETNWTFPTTIQPGNFDSLVAQYPTLAQVGNIGCESCHGAGNSHLGNTSKIGVTIQVGVCAQCHDATPRYPVVAQWKNSAHATPFYTNSFRQLPSSPEYMTNSFNNCVRCHDAQGFINLTKGQYTATDSLYRYNLNNKSCTMCHEPHNDTQNEYQLRKITADTLKNGYVIPTTFGTGGLCMNCHKDRRVPNYIDITRISSAGFGPHGSPQTDMLLGKSAYNWGMELPSSVGHTLVEDGCVGCHMASPVLANATDSLALNHIGGHSWWMVYTDSLGNEHDNVGKCVDCHAGIQSFDDIQATADYDDNGEVTSFFEELEGLLLGVRKALPPFGVDSISWQMIRDSPDSLTMKRALFDYNFVRNGVGVHNPKYAVSLLRTSIEMLELLHTVGQIGSLKDVPNDQGKQIQIKWLKFPGETYIVPIKFYGAWRLDAGSNAKTTIQVQSFDELAKYYSSLSKGTVVTVGNDVWTFVGWSPVSGMDIYSLNVPTLFDSTIVAGQYWTKFKISGHGADYTPLAWSNVDSGYTVDNLSPHAVGNFAASVIGSAVHLSWVASADPDVNYYQIFRDTVEIGDIGNRQPIATTTDILYNDANVVFGKRYYYVVRALDFSGNSGALSRVSILLLGIDNGMELPKEFALKQNYPNPFNPTTTIYFDVPKNGTIKIDVFNVFGQYVKTLVNKEYSPGKYSVNWNGDDDNYQSVSSGVYFCRMQTEGFVTTRKLVLMK